MFAKLFKKFVKKKPPVFALQNSVENNNSNISSSTNAIIQTLANSVISENDVIIHTACIVGKGSFGKVYKGTYANSEVAIKVMPLNSTQASPWEEAKMLNQVRDLERVITFHGWYASLDSFHLITEYAPNGSLDDWIENKELPDWPGRYQIFKNICLGVQSLHARGIIHRDLKSGNILMMANYEIKICDFGMALPTLYHQGEYRGTVPWSAPESIGYGIYRPASDVYSIGSILIELVNEEEPFKQDPASIEALMYKISQGAKQALFKPHSKKIEMIVHACQQFESEKRPTTDELAEELNTDLDSVSEKFTKKFM